MNLLFWRRDRPAEQPQPAPRIEQEMLVRCANRADHPWSAIDQLWMMGKRDVYQAALADADGQSGEIHEVLLGLVNADLVAQSREPLTMGEMARLSYLAGGCDWWNKLPLRLASHVAGQHAFYI